jgi:hypothetical protein
MAKKYPSDEELTEEKLKETHELYDKYYDEWKFLNASYEGVRALIAWGVFAQHERESEKNYLRRKNEAYGFTYSRSIVDLLNSYLFKKDYPRTIPETLGKDEQWIAFQEDCTHDEEEFDEFFIDQSRQASIQGLVGILVDKPRVATENKQQQLDEEIYPYLAAYKPTHILDWEYEVDINGQKHLTYLKLLDDDDYYRIWTRETWEIWEVVEAESKDVSQVGSERGSKTEQVGRRATKVAQGTHDLGEIPFVWLYNQRSVIDKDVGLSDISDVSRIDVSIMRNLSQVEEIVNYSAFPMMRKPKREIGGEASTPDQKDEVGESAILEFDPDNPEGTKADWLDSEAQGPITAILEVIAKKVSEIYRATNVGGMAATEIQTQAKSGVALKAEFQLLNSKLVRKGKNVVKAKRGVTRFWLMWQGEWEKYKGELRFDYVKTFEVEDLMTDLENMLTSKVIITDSPEYTKEIQKMAVRMMIPSAEDKLLATIDAEIDEGPEFPDFPLFDADADEEDEDEGGGGGGGQPPGSQPPDKTKLKTIKGGKPNATD